MPSAPRSKACQNCKARRIKCDQNWPTCTPCRLKKLSCAGPSALTKFFNLGVKSPDADVQNSLSSNLVVRPGPPQPHGSRLERTARKTIKCLLDGQNDDQARFYTFRLNPPAPAPNLTTSAERVSARLVTHLTSASGQPILTLLDYLHEIPRYLNDNPSLRDSVDLFCSAWATYRRGLDADRFIDMPAYGKAIRSLRRTLQSDKAVTVQTLASIVILSRAEEFFDPGQKRKHMMHEKGLRNLVFQLGAPERDDELQKFLMVETLSLLLPYFMITGESNFMTKPPWGDIINQCLVERTEGPHLLPPLLLHYSMDDKIPKIIHQCPSLRQDPYNPETFKLVMLTIAELQQMDEDADKVWPEAMRECLRLKQVIERPVPESLTETSYEFTNIIVPRLLVSLSYVRLIILRVRYDWSDVYQLPNKKALFTKTRALCIHLWKYIPYLLGLESFIASIFHYVLYPTFEFATEPEKEYLLDFFVETDRYRKRLPTNRDELRQTIIHYAKLATGRLPMRQYSK